MQSVLSVCVSAFDKIHRRPQQRHHRGEDSQRKLTEFLQIDRTISEARLRNSYQRHHRHNCNTREFKLHSKENQLELSRDLSRDMMMKRVLSKEGRGPLRCNGLGLSRDRFLFFLSPFNTNTTSKLALKSSLTKIQ